MSTATLSHMDALTRLGNALADSTRTRILMSLRDAPACPSDLAEALGVSRQVMSNQLACLRGCGLVEKVPAGRRSWYRLADPKLGDVLGSMLELVLEVEPGCCAPGGCSCNA
ncbi:transcriptional regulator [Aeromicrobium sp. PE09-221]|uniref:ArsR/SmtB family transcription factor n=1 Tax=Aeromicrobium sp. PE09-221 TaxID=1898043 RepID=UPI000B3E89A0|nr:metalloregulator ArsR/SmtB family transcription factor [Aeromicrobium sp. PE09-221]OUZ10506.1 transcriptional regulator [Aeromicrobium sp. PE09-221]